MDSSWLLEEAVVDSLESDKSDSEEVDHELESRLYSIVHHNDLSQPLPAELLQHYSLQHYDDGEVTVTLNQPLDQLRSEEIKHIGELLEPHEPVSGSAVGAEEVLEVPDDDVVIVSEVIHCQHSKKKLRYSDVNIDQWNESQKSNNDVDNLETVSESTIIKTSDSNESVNDVDLFKSILFSDPKNYQKFSDIKFPSFPGTSFSGSSDWKSNSNASFIPIGSEAVGKPPIFKNKFLKALKDLNPCVAYKKLRQLVHIIFQRNFKDVEPTSRKKLREHMRKNLINGLDIMTNFQIKRENSFLENSINKNNETSSKKGFHESLQYVNKNDNNIYLNISPSDHTLPKIDSIKNKQNYKSKNKINGCVSLKSSPFRPTPLLTQNIIKDIKSESNNEMKSKIHSKKIVQPYIPTKWTKKMINFYTMPPNKKLKKSLSSIFQRFDRTTSVEDWFVDQLDETGVYHRPVSGKKKPQWRCKNCKQRDHSAQNCPEPKRVTACFLCGDYYHLGYDCYKAVCMKCGVYAPEGECQACYFQNFEYCSSCERCGSALHRTPHCPDSWRSFHSTIEGELKIPEASTENKRRFCCNCARRGHFAHKCPTPLHTGQQSNPFVTNYSDTTVQQGTTEIFFSKNFGEILSCPTSDEFFQNLSTSSNAVISVNQQNGGTSVSVTGTFDQCANVKSKIETYVNTKKRKREEPPMRRKRRRLK